MGRWVSSLWLGATLLAGAACVAERVPFSSGASDAGARDANEDPWSPVGDGFNGVCFNGSDGMVFADRVRAVAQGDDGTVYVGGEFHAVGPWRGSVLSVDLDSGGAFASLPQVRGFAVTVAADGEGGVLVVGEDLTVGGRPTGNLVRVVPGQPVPEWSLEYDGYGASGVRGPSALYLVGFFDAVAGVARGGLAAIDLEGRVLDWAPQLDGPARRVVAEDNRFFLFGRFTQVDGQPRDKVAVFDHAGQLLPIAVELHPFESPVHAQSERLYTAEGLDDSSRVVLRARSLATGSVLWSTELREATTAPNPGNTAVHGVVATDEAVYVFGWFDFANDLPRVNLAVLDSDGRVSPTVIDLRYDHLRTEARRVVSPGEVQALAVVDGVVYVAGAFNWAQGARRLNAAAFRPDGSLLPWDPSADDGVTSLVVTRQGVVLGGRLQSVGAKERQNLAAFSPQGELLDWDPYVEGVVDALAFHDGVLYVGGTFSAIDGAPRSHAAALDADGRLLNWAPNIDCDCWQRRYGSIRYPGVADIVVHGDDIYLAGAFNAVGGELRTGLAALDLDGRILSFAPSVDVGTGRAIVNDIEIDGSTMYAGGIFETVGGERRNGLAALSVSGDLLPWSPSSNPVELVATLAVRDDVVYVGGWNEPLAAFDTSGNLLPWAPQRSGSVESLIVEEDLVFVGGASNDSPVGLSVLPAFETNAPVPEVPWIPGRVHRVWARDDRLYVGGEFQSVAHGPGCGFAVFPLPLHGD